MAQVYGHKTLEKTSQPLLGSQMFRLLLCVFIFTVAAVCKNILPDGYREAIVMGLDSGLTFRDVLEVFGESASSQEAFSRLWSDGVLKVFGLSNTEQEVSGDISDEASLENQDTEQESAVSASLDMSQELTIPVTMRSAVSFDIGDLPAYTTIFWPIQRNCLKRSPYRIRKVYPSSPKHTRSRMRMPVFPYPRS